MTRQPARADRGFLGVLEGIPASLAILLGMIAVAVGGLQSFGYLMLRSPPGSDVSEIPAFVAATAVVESPSRIEIWRGVPRYPTAADIQAGVRRTFGWFEPTPIETRDQDSRWLRNYCILDRHFKRMETDVYKLCGWFHADFAVVFTNEAQTAEFAFCFGCNEVKIAVEGYEPLHLDLASPFVLRTYFEPYFAK